MCLMLRADCIPVLHYKMAFWVYTLVLASGLVAQKCAPKQHTLSFHVWLWISKKFIAVTWRLRDVWNSTNSSPFTSRERRTVSLLISAAIQQALLPFCWDIGTRTLTEGTKILSATITPYLRVGLLRGLQERCKHDVSQRQNNNSKLIIKIGWYPEQDSNLQLFIWR